MVFKKGNKRSEENKIKIGKGMKEACEGGYCICEICGYEWQARFKEKIPTKCAKCLSPLWNIGYEKHCENKIKQLKQKYNNLNKKEEDKNGNTN